MALTALAGGSLFGRRHGDGPPRVVALHGWGRRNDDFAPILEGVPSIAVDLPGFGASPPPASPIGSAGYADAIVPVLEEIGHPVTLLGHSFGGRVAVVIAARRPDLVDRLIITGVPLLRRATGGKPPPSYRAARWANKVGVLSDERMDRLRRARGSADYNAASGVMRQVFVTVVNEDYRNELAAIATDVTMIWGEADTAAPAAMAEEAAELLRQAGSAVTLLVVEDADHFIPLTRPDLFRDAIGDRQ